MHDGRRRDVRGLVWGVVQGRRQRQMIRKFPRLEHRGGHLGMIVVPEVAFGVQEAVGFARLQGQGRPGGVWFVGEHDEPADVMEHAIEEEGLTCRHLGLDGKQPGQDAAGDAVRQNWGMSRSSWGMWEKSETREMPKARRQSWSVPRRAMARDTVSTRRGPAKAGLLATLSSRVVSPMSFWMSSAR